VEEVEEDLVFDENEAFFPISFRWNRLLKEAETQKIILSRMCWIDSRMSSSGVW